MGFSNSYLKPNAIVMPPWETHKAYIRKRAYSKYNSVLREEDLSEVKAHRLWIEHWKAVKVPRYEAIVLAAQILENPVSSYSFEK